MNLFGSAWLAYDGAPRAFSAPPACLALLAFLALRRQPVRRAVIAAALWPDETDAEGRANLRRHVHRLKRALPDGEGLGWLLDDGGALAWNHDAAQVDVATFLTDVANADRAAEAVELYRGDLLEGYEDEWLVIERERLRMLFLGALHVLCAARRRSRDFPAAVRYAERLLAEDDLNEDALRELVSAQYEQGDRASALATFDRFASRLRDALSAEPMAESLALRDAIAGGLQLQALHELTLGRDAFGRGPRDTAFVGRRSELDGLQRAWTRAARGFGGTIMLAGEAGMGKSRLAAEFSELVERQGGRVLVGLTSQVESAPYQALVTAAQRGLPALGRDALGVVWGSALTGVLPEIRAIQPDLVAAEPLDEARSRLRLHEAFARFFDTIARGRPLVLVLEDLHWAGSDTIEAVEALARRATGAPLLLVATYRPDEGDASLGIRRLARVLQSEQRATRTTLGPLRADEIGDLIARTSAFDGAPDDLSPAVARLSEGNPLFAWQLLRSFEETRRVPDADGAVRSVGDAILSRIERLRPGARAVAEAAATVGSAFTVEFIAEAGGWSERVVRDGLEELRQRHLVYASADDESYAFAHGLIANAVYAATEPEAREPRHRRIARLLQRTDVANSATLGLQARHWDLAGERGNAYRAYVGAANAARAVYAQDEAAVHARRAADLAADDAQEYAALAIALQTTMPGDGSDHSVPELERFEAVAERLGDAERFVALEAWSDYWARAGDAAGHARVVAKMSDLAEASHDERRRITTLDAEARMLLLSGRVAEAEPLLSRAIELAQIFGDESLHARVSMRFCNVQVRLGNRPVALELVGRRRAALAASNSPVDWLELFMTEINCAFVLEEMEIGERAAVEQLALAERIGELESAGTAHGTLSYVAHSRGDAAGMRAHSDRAIEVFERIHHERPLAATLANRGVQEFELGRIDDAVRFWERSEQFAEHVGASEAALAINRAEAELLRERFATAEEIANAALTVARKNGERRHIAEALVVLGAARSAVGKHEEGLRDLHAAIELRREVGGQRSLPEELCHLIEALLRVGDLAAAGEAAQELAACDAIASKYPARVQLVLSRFHTAAGDAAAAKRCADAGRAVLRRRLSELSSADAKAYRALPFSRALSSAAAATR